MQNTLHRIVFLGPQGSGKGTQAELLGKKLNVPKISTGDLYRNHIRNKTEIGGIAEKYLNEGKLVPSEVTVKMMISRLSDCQIAFTKDGIWKKETECGAGFILDGFPRDREQFDALAKFTPITHAIEVWISDKEAIHRLGGRRSCRCGEVYHIKYKPPRNDGVCDKCGQKLYIRDDDKPEAIQTRLKIYHEQTEPLIDAYKEQGVHIKINGEQTIEEVHQDILKELGLV